MNHIGEFLQKARKRGCVQLGAKAVSLKSLMSNCLDSIEEEETFLQSIRREMVVVVDQTSKCHCEVARKEIKYSWCCAKNFNCRVALWRKKGGIKL